MLAQAVVVAVALGAVVAVLAVKALVPAFTSIRFHYYWPHARAGMAVVVVVVVVAVLAVKARVLACIRIGFY